MSVIGINIDVPCAFGMRWLKANRFGRSRGTKSRLSASLTACRYNSFGAFSSASWLCFFGRTSRCGSAKTPSSLVQNSSTLWFASGEGYVRPVNDPILSPLVESPSSSRNGHSSVARPEIPVAAATRIASSSNASGTGSLSDLKPSGPVSSAPSAKRRERRVKIDSSTGNARACASAPGCTVGRGTSLRRRSGVTFADLNFGVALPAALTRGLATAGFAFGATFVATFGATFGAALATRFFGFSMAAMLAPSQTILR